MPEEKSSPRFQLILRVCSETTLPEQITALSGVNPTSTDLRFSKAGGRAPKSHMWRLHADATDGHKTIAEQWAMMRNAVLVRATAIADLPIDCDGRLEVVISSPTTPDVVLPGEMIRFTKDARIALEVFCYDSD